MKIKTSELIDEKLDWAVASIEGVPEWFHNDVWVTTGGLFNHVHRRPYNPSKKWSQGGPIIEREKIAIDWDHDCWNAYVYGSTYGGYSSGPTALVAAMRNYVASKLGDEVEIPEELV